MSQLPIGYGLSLQTARQWGLYISESKGKTSVRIEEPARFSEPGVFLVKPDGTLYYGSVQTMPFARPNFADLIGAIDCHTKGKKQDLIFLYAFLYVAERRDADEAGIDGEFREKKD